MSDESGDFEELNLESVESENVDTETEFTEFVDELNAVRIDAWHKVLYAIAAIAAVGLVYIVTQEWVWTGGLAVAGLWLLNSARSLFAADREIKSLEAETSQSLKYPLPTSTKLGIWVGIPAAIILSLNAVNTYDPTIFSSETAVVESDTTTTSTTVEQGVPTIIETFDMTEAELELSDLEYEVGIRISVPEICDRLILNWHSENEAGQEIGSYWHEFESYRLGDVNKLSFGGSGFTDEEIYFIADSVVCE